MIIRYIGTKEMKADGLSKVLGGADFKEFVKVALGHTPLNKPTGERWVRRVLGVALVITEGARREKFEY
jgi:hypothetical protein